MQREIINRSFEIGTTHVEMNKFDPSRADRVQRLIQENVEKIIVYWGLDPSRERHIQILFIDSTYDEVIYLSNTVFGSLVKILFFLCACISFLFVFYKGIGIIQNQENPIFIFLEVYMMFSFLNVILACLVAIVYFSSFFLAKRLRESDRGTAIGGRKKSIISIDSNENGILIDEVITHELCHALCTDLHLPRFFLSEGLAQVTSEFLTGRLPITIQRDKGGYFQDAIYYTQKHRYKYSYVYSYWIVRYLTRDDASKGLFVSALHEKPFWRSFNQELGRRLNIKKNLKKTLALHALSYFGKHIAETKDIDIDGIR